MPASLLLIALLLSADPPADAGVVQPVPPESSRATSEPTVSSDAGVADEAPPNDGRVHLRAAAEASVTSFPSGTLGGQQDVLVDLRPVLGIDIGENFSAEVGAEFRLRLIDDAPGQRSTDIGGVLRRADWDEASDFGQIIHALRIGRPDTVFWIQAGSLRKKTLGLGHLITRYSNQDNPDYHPAAATMGVAYKAVHAELFASDIFGARIFAGELAIDIGRLFTAKETVWDRFHLAFSAAHDFGLAGYVAGEVTLVQFDLDAVFYRGDTTRMMGLIGLGTRTADALDPTPNLGFLAGVSIDSMLGAGFAIGARVELRKQQGGFRQGFIGAGYEIARFSDTGFTGLSRAAEQLPDGFSFAGELHLARGSAVAFDFGLEYFNWGRTDLDALFSLEIIDHRLVAGARFTGTGLGKVPRYALTSELRVRLFSSFYVMASGGTVFFPQPDGTVVRGVEGGAGVGIDFER